MSSLTNHVGEYVVVLKQFLGLSYGGIGLSQLLCAVHMHIVLHVPAAGRCLLGEGKKFLDFKSAVRE